ncbi:MAG: helix-turn-helix transcriptional regulator [Actinomycetota bacterium]|nr:helix-turn-helix transcriptional regulator [Actinomycetota bacterium]
MISSENASHEVREKITSFLFWYRIATLALVAVLTISGITVKALVPLAVALLYNAFVMRFRANILPLLQSRPYLLSIDFAFSCYVLSSSGGFASPYYLYVFGTMMIGSFIFAYRGALILASVQSVILIWVVNSAGYTISSVVDLGEHLITDITFYYLTALSFAYLSGLLRALDIANTSMVEVGTELKSATERFRGLLGAGDLSPREQEVLLHALDGKKIEDIAGDLKISTNTIKTHLSRSYRKLGVVSRDDAILKLVMHGAEAI